MGFKEIFKPAHFNKLLIVLAVMVVLVFVFSLGVFVGHEKGRFSRNWGEHYYGNVMGQGKRGFGMMDFNRSGFNAHSGLGQIIKIENNSLIIKDQDNIEKTILITDKTAIIRDRQNIGLADLSVDDKIIVIGQPNDRGQIEPTLIRVLPNQQ
ncbi:MAG: hypothetical protein Q8O59_03955 [bacterium]|nr:hypothetical protein [bacterium]